MPDKRDAGASLPLGLADKLFLSLENAEEFPVDLDAVGRTDTSATGSYHIRPSGQPLIQAYFAGELAKDLERSGERGFVDFAINELTGIFGSAFATRLQPIGMHLWGTDPLAGGSYSYASPGAASARAQLAEPVDDRIYFAGEACSPNVFSTAHGAYETGVAAVGRIARGGR